MTPAEVTVEVSGLAVPRFNRHDMAAFARKVLRTLDSMKRLDREISEVSIGIVADSAMRSLNRGFRHINRTTDVLTFPADASYGEPGDAGHPLGDIAISLDQARRQAAAERHAVGTEVRYLILHGILHALGYDHESDAGEMNALEIEVRRRVGLE
ncbi:MAG TPA: rRNA maturation RNase YbeY [Thermoanaerobaculia bacterium]|nr:rRNA maturation RNase YbeY [Thermoanaerobaculia bacterium]